jgi:hypothetical protein
MTKSRVIFLLAPPNRKLFGDYLFGGAPRGAILFILFANHRESISRRPDLEHLDTPPANVRHHLVFTAEYWQCPNPLDGDDAVTVDTGQHARAAATGLPAWPPQGAW